MRYTSLKKTGLRIPAIIFGTSCLGNLYEALDDEVKLKTLEEMFANMDDQVVLDSAGKYGAGLALEVIGSGLQSLGVQPEQVIISNKLGWYHVPLQTPEPTFEPGVWKGIGHDAVQKISYRGILECWEQGCELLGDQYVPQMVSVHDPDEYLAATENTRERKNRFSDIIDAYHALIALRDKNETKAVGVGAKDWKTIREIRSHVDLDWVMFANSLTIYSHPDELMLFIEELHRDGIGVVNSAVFHAGFLTGGKYFDYRIVNREAETDKPLFEWRDRFFTICEEYGVKPAEACVQFAISHPAVMSIALNTSKPERILQNIRLVSAAIPGGFWQAMKTEGLISGDYAYV